MAVRPLAVQVVPSPTTGYVGDTFIFDVSWSGEGPFDVTISYGDGTSDSVSEVTWTSYSFSHVYSSSGTMYVDVTVIDLYTGIRDTGSTSVTVLAPELSVTFTADKTTGPIPLNVTFTISISGGVPPHTWSLNYGDGTGTSGTLSSAGTFTKIHTYDKVGTFTAVLAVTDSAGASAVKRGEIYAGTLPTPTPAVLTIAGPISLGIAFTFLGMR